MILFVWDMIYIKGSNFFQMKRSKGLIPLTVNFVISYATVPIDFKILTFMNLGPNFTK